jgi:hypothetical protein
VTLGDRVVERLRSPHLTSWLGVITVAVVIATLALAALYGPDILNSTSAVEEGNNLASCRSLYAANVTDKRTDLDIVSSELRRMNTLTDNAQIAVTRDALFNDGANVVALLAQLQVAGDEELAFAAQVIHAEDALKRENRTYQAALNLSREDPAAFAAGCKELNP